MGGVYQTEFEVPVSQCSELAAALLDAGVPVVTPFEVTDDESVLDIRISDQPNEAFMLSFWSVARGGHKRRMDLHWHRFRGSDGDARARFLALQIQRLALTHGAICTWGQVAEHR